MCLSLPAHAATIRYVELNNPSPASPYTSWATAATNIQDAVDASTNGDQVLVTNGVYQSGGKAVSNALTNRVAITKPITVQSVNGPDVTIIQGYQVPGTTNGNSAVRCVYLTNGAALIGFTLTNGATSQNTVSPAWYAGGGVYSESTNAVVSNCVIVANSALAGGGTYNCFVTDSILSKNSSGYFGGGSFNCVLRNSMVSQNLSSSSGGGGYNCVMDSSTVVSNSAQFGGGVDSGVLKDCLITKNIALYEGGGAWKSTLRQCTLASNSVVSTNASPTAAGGGAYNCALESCVLVGNSSSARAGGAYGGSLQNCIVSFNSAVGTGGGLSVPLAINCLILSNSAAKAGGAFAGTLTHCTIIGNSARSQGGVDVGTLNNCIVYYNTAVVFASNYTAYDFSHINSSCSTPLPTGAGHFSDNITNEPLFVASSAGNFRLQSNSPCINSGNNSYVNISSDLDGNARIAGGTVDIGAYELQTPSSLISYAWLEQYALTTDGSADFTDVDSDGMSNYQEWISATDPLNNDSVLRMLIPASTDPSVALTWTSVTNRTYWLERATTLALPPVFSPFQSNIAGLAGTTSFTDTNPPASSLYRVGVHQ